MKHPKDRFQWSPGAIAMIYFLDPSMRPCLHRGIEILSEATDGVDVALDQTLRTPQQAAANAKSGAGIINSMHLPNSRGHSRAFDFRTVGKSQAARYALGPLRIIRGAMLQAFDEAKVIVRSGSDWNCNGIEIASDMAERGQRVDLVHIELVESTHHRYQAALSARIRRIAARQTGTQWPL